MNVGRKGSDRAKSGKVRMLCRARTRWRRRELKIRHTMRPV